MKEIERLVEIVKSDMLQRFPQCQHTVMITLWDDGTHQVECRHGNLDGTRLYRSTYYNGELTFTETDITGKVMIIGKSGESHFKYLSDSPN